jgi:O-methyltransferase involved in polyketide biosynthesis
VTVEIAPPPSTGAGMSTDPLPVLPDVPSVVRLYDYLLGGKDNFTADRALAEKMITAEPALCDLAKANREFLGRAVRYLVAAGVRQFIDLGTGLPTPGHLHERLPDDARAVYVDRDLMVVRHAQALISASGTVAVKGDLRQPNRILANPDVRRLIDFDQPCAVVMGSVPRFLSEDDCPDGTVATFYEHMAPGSYLVLTHATGDAAAASTKVAAVRELYAQTDPAADKIRPRGQARLGIQLVERALRRSGATPNVTVQGQNLLRWGDR